MLACPTVRNSVPLMLVGLEPTRARCFHTCTRSMQHLAHLVFGVGLVCCSPLAGFAPDPPDVVESASHPSPPAGEDQIKVVGVLFPPC